MKVEFFNSVSVSGYWQALLRAIESKGGQVSEISTITETRYRGARGRLQRGGLRLQMYPGMGLKALLHRGDRESIRVATTNPFFLPALVAGTGGRRPSVNLLYDLFPDALTLAGAVRRGSFVERQLSRLTRFAFRRCSATVFLGERLREHAIATYGSPRHSVVIPVGAEGAPFADSPPESLPPDQRLIVLYSGQMGAMHEVETISRFLSEGGGAGLRWLFHTSGSRSAWIQNALKDTGAVFGGPLSHGAWIAVMKQAQVALITMSPGSEKVVMPSKTFSALVAGQAVLAICPLHSDLADIILKHDCGWVVEPGDLRELGRVVLEIERSKELVLQKRLNAFRAGHVEYDVGVIADRWLDLFSFLQSGKASR